MSEQKIHYEIIPAKKYYGKHATGVVLLRNGCVEFHGERAEAKKILNMLNQKNKKWQNYSI